MENTQSDGLVPTPQATQVYRLIGDLMEIVRQRYANAPKATRNLTMTLMWRTLAEMSGDFCMAYTCRRCEEKLAYYNRLRNRYYQVEAMMGDLMKSKVITVGFYGEIAKTKMTPLIKQVNGLIRKTENRS